MYGYKPDQSYNISFCVFISEKEVLYFRVPSD